MARRAQNDPRGLASEERFNECVRGAACARASLDSEQLAKLAPSSDFTRLTKTPRRWGCSPCRGRLQAHGGLDEGSTQVHCYKLGGPDLATRSDVVLGPDRHQRVTNHRASSTLPGVSLCRAGAWLHGISKVARASRSPPMAEDDRSRTSPSALNSGALAGGEVILES